MFVKPPNIDFTPRNKMKRHGRTVRMAKTKKIVKEERKREFIKALKSEQVQGNETAEEKPISVLDRFKPTTKIKK